MRRLIVGDIHACWAEFQDLLDLAGLADGDEVVAVGDIVDRGPEPAAVLEFFRERPGARSLLGNHERKHVRARRGEMQLAPSQRITRWQLGEAYGEAVEFMATCPLWLELPEAVVVHGFWEPGVELADQKEMVLAGTLPGEAYLRRYGCPWWELYDRSLPLIVGHHDYLGTGRPLVYEDRVFGLDTGCCQGSALTGLLLPEFRILSVPSRANYWSRLRGEFGRVERRERRAAARPGVELEGAAARRLLLRLSYQSERLHAELGLQPDFNAATPREQGKILRARTGSDVLAALLSLARRGELDEAKLRRVVRTREALSEVQNLLARPGS